MSPAIGWRVAAAVLFALAGSHLQPRLSVRAVPRKCIVLAEHYTQRTSADTGLYGWFDSAWGRPVKNGYALVCGIPFMLGVAFGLLAATCWGFSAILVRLGLQHLRPTTGTWMSVIPGGIIVMSLALVVLGVVIITISKAIS